MEDKRNKLKKELNAIDVFSVASGAMISSGLFVLPAIIYLIAGPSIILAYIFAAILIMPAMFSKAELATAMPKSGGTYFFIYRSLGPLFGTFAGLASWFSLSLKSAFALLGMGIFLQPLFPSFTPGTVKLIAVAFTILFTYLNVLSVKESGRFQVALVLSLVGILFIYIFSGLNYIDVNRYVPFKPGGWVNVFTATGMVFISFGGLTKIASVAEEIKDPGKAIARGMFSAFFVVTLIYVLTIFVTTGLLDRLEFQQTLTPISLAASKHIGTFGFVILSVAAMLAFATTANAGLLAASRNPLAMAKDNLLPSFFSRISIRFKTPTISILITSLFMIAVITVLDLKSLVKVASTMMLILFSLVNISMILMRESKIVSYKPAFKAPFYPYIQIIGTVFYIALIIEMGRLPLLITVMFFILSILWFLFYSKSRNLKDSALIHIVERVTSKEIKSSTLPNELKEILIERDEIIEDRFDRLIQNATIIDLDEKIDVHELFRIVSEIYSKKFGMPSETAYELLHSREKDSTTAIQSGLAIPHIIIEGESEFDIVLLRSIDGISFGEDIPPVHMVFALAGTKNERNFHLKALMAIAQVVQNRDFISNWMKAGGIEELRNLVLLADRVRKGRI